MRWLTVPLGDVAEVAAGGGAPQDQADFGSEGYPFVRAGSLKALISGGDTAPLERLAPATAATHKLRLFPANTVLFAKSGMSASIGLVHRLQWPAYVVNHLAAVMCGEQLDSAFLHHYLRAFSPSRLIQDAAYPSIRLGDIAGMKVPLPSIQDQRRIAAILDQADALRAKRREALALLDELQRGIFIEMFGDPATNPKKWPVRAVGDLLASASYGTSEKSSADGKFPVLRMNNITRSGEMDLSDLKYMDLDESQHERYLVRQGDVLFNRTNSADLVGKTAIYRRSEPMAYAGYLIRLRINAANDPEYLAGFMNTSYAKRTLRSMCKSIIGMANINATEVQAMKIPQPPLELQSQYAKHVETVMANKAAHRRALEELDALFASLQSRAFRGEL